MSNKEKNILLDPQRWNKRKIGVAAVSILGVGAIAGSMFAGVWIGGDSGSSFGTKGNIAFMPNTKALNDKSFNYETNKGVAAFNHAQRTDYEVFIPKTSAPSVSEYRNLLTTASKGNKGIVTNGFMPVDALMGVMDFGTFTRAEGGWLLDPTNKDKYVQIIDDYGFNQSIGSNGLTVDISNGISMNFKSQEAGFFAGLAAALEAVQNGSVVESNGHKVARISTWGGDAYDTVYDWMSGYEQAVNWFNYQIMGYNNLHQAVTNKAANYAALSGDPTSSLQHGQGVDARVNRVEIVSASVKAEVKDDNILIDYNKTPDSGGATQHQIWMSGSFEPGTLGQNMAVKANQRGASVIFPVAGAQTGDAIDSIIKNSINAKVIGVDTDISEVYTSEAQKDIVMGSATKNLSEGTEFLSWYTDKWMNTYTIKDIGTENEYVNTYEQSLAAMLNDGSAYDYGMWSRHIMDTQADATFNAATDTWNEHSYLTPDSEKGGGAEGTANWVSDGNGSKTTSDGGTTLRNDQDMFQNDQFLGNYGNKGSNFVTSGGEDLNGVSTVEKNTTTFFTELDPTSGIKKFSDFMDSAFNMQGSQGIESHSETFAFGSGGYSGPKHDEAVAGFMPWFITYV